MYYVFNLDGKCKFKKKHYSENLAPDPAYTCHQLHDLHAALGSKSKSDTHIDCHAAANLLHYHGSRSGSGVVVKIKVGIHCTQCG